MLWASNKTNKKNNTYYARKQQIATATKLCNFCNLLDVFFFSDNFLFTHALQLLLLLLLLLQVFVLRFGLAFIFPFFCFFVSLCECVCVCLCVCSYFAAVLALTGNNSANIEQSNRESGESTFEIRKWEGERVTHTHTQAERCNPYIWLSRLHMSGFEMICGWRNKIK